MLPLCIPFLLLKENKPCFAAAAMLPSALVTKKAQKKRASLLAMLMVMCQLAVSSSSTQPIQPEDQRHDHNPSPHYRAAFLTYCDVATSEPAKAALAYNATAALGGRRGTTIQLKQGRSMDCLESFQLLTGLWNRSLQAFPKCKAEDLSPSRQSKQPHCFQTPHVPLSLV